MSRGILARRLSAFFHKRSNSKGFSWLILIFAATYLIFTVFSRLTPIVTQTAAYKIKNTAQEIISDAIAEEFQKGDYSHLISYEKSEDGKIIAMETDIVKANLLKANISKSILNRFDSLEPDDIKIPIGSLMANEFFVGRGPLLSIRIVPIEAIDINFISAFSSAGINHTKHQILLEINITLKAILPTISDTVAVSSIVIVSEAILVGEVPDSYTYIDVSGKKLIEKIS